MSCRAFLADYALSISKPTLTWTSPAHVVVAAGAPVYLWCAASGTPTPSVSWSVWRAGEPRSTPLQLQLQSSPSASGAPGAAAGGDSRSSAQAQTRFTLTPIAHGGSALRLASAAVSHGATYKCEAGSSLSIERTSFNITLSGVCVCVCVCVYRAKVRCAKY